MRGPQQRELLRAAMAGRNPGARIAAQDEGVPSGTVAAFDIDVDRPVLLDGAAPQRLQSGDLHPLRVGRSGDEAAEALPRFRIDQREAGHRQSQKSAPSVMKARASTIL